MRHSAFILPISDLSCVLGGTKREGLRSPAEQVSCQVRSANTRRAVCGVLLSGDGQAS